MQSYRHPNATWKGSPNCTPDRLYLDGVAHDMAIQPAYVVLHTMVGTAESADARFQQPNQASSHYGVLKNGDLWQWVDEKDAAWTNNSLVENPGSNLDSITIEHEDSSQGGVYSGGYTDEQYSLSATLVHEICQRYGIPFDREHVIGHRETAGGIAEHTNCPDDLDVDRILQMALGSWVDPRQQPPPLPAPVPPTVPDPPYDPRVELQNAATIIQGVIDHLARVHG